MAGTKTSVRVPTPFVVPILPRTRTDTSSEKSRAVLEREYLCHHASSARARPVMTTKTRTRRASHSQILCARCVLSLGVAARFFIFAPRATISARDAGFSEGTVCRSCVSCSRYSRASPVEPRFYWGENNFRDFSGKNKRSRRHVGGTAFICGIKTSASHI